MKVRYFYRILFFVVISGFELQYANAQDMNGWHGIGMQFFLSSDVLSEQKLIVVGDGGQIRLSSDFGNSWRSRNQNDSLNFKSVSFIDSLNGLISAYFGNILLTSDGGDTWIESRKKTTVPLFKIQMVTRDTVFGCGSHGSIIRSTNGGWNWETLQSGTMNELRNIYFINSQNGFAIGDSGTILRTVSGGNVWQPITLDSNIQVLGIDFLDSLHGIICGKGNIIFFTVDGGVSWKRSWIVSNTELLLSSIQYLSLSRITANGLSGIFETNNGGKDWASIHLPKEMSGISILLNSGFDKEKKRGVIVGYPSIILTSSNSGSSWDQSSSCPILNTFLTDIRFFDTLNGYAVGNTNVVMGTTNGGETWKSLVENLNSTQIWRIYAPSIDTAWTIGWYSWLVTTTNGWKTSQVVPPPTVNELNITNYRQPTDICMIDRNSGFIIGDSIFWKTTDGGKKWLPTIWHNNYLSLLERIVCPTQTTSFAYGYYNIPIPDTIPKGKDVGALLRTQNAGVSWELLDYGTTARIHGFFFWDDKTGIIICDSGVVIKTFDGGNSWIRMPNVPDVKKGTSLFTGMNFINRTVGYALVTGGKILLTTDAGNSWSVDLDLNITTAKDYAVLERIIFPDSNAVMICGYQGILKKKIDLKQLSVQTIESGPQNKYSWIALTQNPISSRLSGKLYWYSSSVNTLSLKIYDIMGRTVQDLTHELLSSAEGNVGNINADVSALPNGVYILLLNADGNVRTERFVISK